MFQMQSLHRAKQQKVQCFLCKNWFHRVVYYNNTTSDWKENANVFKLSYECSNCTAEFETIRPPTNSTNVPNLSSNDSLLLTTSNQTEYFHGFSPSSLNSDLPNSLYFQVSALALCNNTSDSLDVSLKAASSPLCTIPNLSDVTQINNSNLSTFTGRPDDDRLVTRPTNFPSPLANYYGFEHCESGGYIL